MISDAIPLPVTPLPDFPNLATFEERHGGGPVPGAELRALHAWLSGLSPALSFAHGAVDLEALVGWLRVGSTDVATTATDRLRLFLDVLDAEPAWRIMVARSIGRVLAEGSALAFLETGLPNVRGLLDETTDRLARSFLPAPREERDIAGLIRLLFPSQQAARWMAELSPDLVDRVARLIASEHTTAGDPWARPRQALLDAVTLISTRATSVGLNPEIRARSLQGPLADSPFLVLRRRCEAVCDGLDSTEACKKPIAACRAALDAVLAHLEQFGVSVDVVYQIEVIGFNLDRLAELLLVMARDSDATVTARLIARLCAAGVRNRSMRDLARTNMRLLARKIIERAGHTGEHYITATRREYWKMLASASGGGVLTTFTTMLKYIILWGHWAPFIEGSLASMNYAASFLLMQLLGFTLATKQPSMTAAALAGSLHGSTKTSDLEPLVTTIARICRSQLAAVVGNLSLVIPTTFVFALAYRRLAGHPFLDAAAAEHTLESFHPTHSGTIFFAALTGVLLWVSSLAAGWVENWAVYRRLPQSIAQHRLGRVVGQRTMARLGQVFARNVAGIGGNVSLGIFLGMLPVFGKFLGVPLEVRHVTLSTGGFTLAASTLGIDHRSIGPALVGIGIMAALNFGVSFVLALGLAMRARAVESAGLRVLGATLVRFYKAPMEFIFPPASVSVEPEEPLEPVKPVEPDEPAQPGSP